MAGAPPALDVLNARARSRDLRSGGNQPLRFVPPDDDPSPYEQRVFSRGEVVTRPNNWHDAHNAEVWLAFPRSKACINRLHVDAMAQQAAFGARDAPSARGVLSDRLTQFDECGVVVAGMPLPLWQALRAHRWRHVFVDARDTVLATTRFVIFGHASRDALAAPYIGLCGKALWLDVSPDVRDDDHALDAALCAALDAWAAPRPPGDERRTATTVVSPRWPPLPLLGLPGMTPDNENPAYYDDERQFRPPRTMAPGSSPDSR